MFDDTTASPSDGDPFDEVRARVREAASADGVAMTKVAEQAGVAYGTFSSFMVGSDEGRNDEVAREARQWLEAREERARTRASMPAGVGFVRTPSADDFWRALSHAQHAPDFVCIAGGAGMGKTSTAQHYADSSPNVWILTAEPVMTSPHGMLSELAELLGVGERAADRRSRAVLHRLRNTAGLLVVDEAQHLTSRTLDQLRSIHDLAHVGVALVGNETVYARLEGEGRRPQFAQLFRRIGMRVSAPAISRRLAATRRTASAHCSRSRTSWPTSCGEMWPPVLRNFRSQPARAIRRSAISSITALPTGAPAATLALCGNTFLAEVAMQRYGALVAQVMLNEPWYREHMPPMKAAFEDAMVTVPRDRELVDDLRGLRMVRGVARIPERTRNDEGPRRHGDGAIALALALFASRAEPEMFGYEAAASVQRSVGRPNNWMQPREEAEDRAARHGQRELRGAL
jgi:DNA transposition AAA+ family ATPase